MKKFEVVSNRGWAVDVLWGQPIKLIQVASDSELHENQLNDHLFFEIVPSHCFGASEVQWNLDLRKILGEPKNFLKSRFFLISNTRKFLIIIDNTQ